MLDSLCKTYGYSHEEVFKLSWVEAMTMVLYNREYNYVDFRATEMTRKQQKAKKKR